MTSKKTHTDKIFWIVVACIIIVNIFLLFRIKGNTLDSAPFLNLNIDKPTLVLVLAEQECAECVMRLRFLNDLYTEMKAEGTIDFKCLVLSKTKVDPKGISSAFVFPVLITDDFRILNRLNLNRTPIIIGLTANRRIIYSDLVPFEIGIEKDQVKNTVIDRLYYSMDFVETQNDN